MAQGLCREGREEGSWVRALMGGIRICLIFLQVFKCSVPESTQCFVCAFVLRWGKGEGQYCIVLAKKFVQGFFLCFVFCCCCYNVTEKPKGPFWPAPIFLPSTWASDYPSISSLGPGSLLFIKTNIPRQSFIIINSSTTQNENGERNRNTDFSLVHKEFTEWR